MAHMHYTGTGRVHSYRGLIGDGKQQKIQIQGAVGAIAWRITKFQIFPQTTDTARDSIVSIWRESQSGVSAGADFSNDELLAAALWYNSTYETDDAVVFDNQLFVRNIWITHFESIGSAAINYYIELEEVKVSAAGMAQLAVAAARRTTEGGT